MTDRLQLRRLAEKAGIIADFCGLDGVQYQTSDDTREALLAAMGIDASSEAAALQAFDEFEDTCLPVEQGLGVGRQAFGLLTHLYAVRGRIDWGIGDLGTLAELVDAAAEIGAAFVGIQPLHVLSSYHGPSPFSPDSRLFRDPIHIDVQEVFATERSEPSGLVDGLDSTDLCRAKYVDYPGVWALKRRALERTHTHFRQHHLQSRTEIGHQFLRYCDRSGDLLQRYANIAQSRDPGTSSEFHCYLQWILDRQLQALAGRCRDRGLSVGLYGDLAVGLVRDGIDTRIQPGIYAQGVSLGAPPDPFAKDGQRWELLPFIPHRLEREGFAPFRELLRRNMEHFGALRIDHAMGLERQYWIPDGKSPRDGAYVRFPVERLLSIVAEESRKNGCIVIGEDLGTVPEGFRDRLERRRILRSQVLYFEREADRTFRRPDQYTPGSLATINTHDLPTLRAFWDQAGAADRNALLRLLEDLDLRPDDDSFEQVSRAVHIALARGESVLVGLWLDDLAGETESVNVPGSSTPTNWRRRLAPSVDALLHDPSVKDLLERVRTARA